MAYTLADYSKLATTNLQAGVVDVLRANSPIMEALQFADEGTLNLEVLRMKSLPTISSRKIGGTFTESKGLLDTVVDRVVNLGVYIDIDKALFKARTEVDQKALQIQMMTKALALHFNNKFINGNASSDYDDLQGIRDRLINDLPSGQSINGASLDISPDASSLSTNIVTFIDKVHELCDLVHEPDYLAMNRTLKLRFESALRQSNMLDTTQDSYGRKFLTFGAGGPKILDIGCTDPLDLTSKIILDTELADGSATTGGACTSMYAVKMGGEYLNGFQLYGLETTDVGWLENGTAYRVIVDWAPGIYVVSPFSLGRIYGLVAA